jgi:predicted RND superfamily exporter protein
MHGFLSLSIRYPRTAIAVVLAITAWMGWEIRLLRVEPDATRLLSPSHAARRRDEDVRRRFELGDPVFVAVMPEARGDGRAAMPSLTTFMHANRLALELVKIPGIAKDRQITIANLRPSSRSTIAFGLEDLCRSPLSVGTLISNDKR